MLKIYRYEVPLDDRLHILYLTHDPSSHIEFVDGGLATSAPYLEFWAPHDTEAEEKYRMFQAYGTGHEIRGHAGDNILWGTAPRKMGLVFHLVEHLKLPTDAIVIEPTTGFLAPMPLHSRTAD